MKWIYLMIVGHLSAIGMQGQSSRHISILFDYHYGNSFITQEQDMDLNGRYGYGVELYYHFSNSKVGTALGLSYARIGNSQSFLWTDATPELEMQYGKFPIRYEMWDDVHYFSIPFMLTYNISSHTFLGTEVSLDYPLGSSYYRKRSSDDGAVVEISKEGFSSTKTYPWNTSIGWAIRAVNTIELSETTYLLIGLKFKVYALLAFRDNDYFPYEDYERPYSLAVNVGISF